MLDAVLLGHGPAAVSAALYLQRAGLKSALVGMGAGSLEKAEKIENYYGLSAPVSGEELYQNGIAQAKSLGAEIITDEVFGVDFDGEGFTVQGKNGSYQGHSVLFATGAARTAPPIPGLKELEGHGVSYCAVCDGFFYRGKTVAVLGEGGYALHEAGELAPLAQQVHLLTNGKEPTADEIPYPVDKRPILRLEGEGVLQRIVFEGGETLEADGLFVALGSATGADLARKTGVETDGRYILVDEGMATNLPGIFAAGDCVGGLLQVSKAVSDGARAAPSMIAFLRKKKKA